MEGAGAGRSDGTGLEPLVAVDVPVDYSFKELRHINELETEEPRSGKRKGQGSASPGAGGGQGTGAENGQGENHSATGASQTVARPVTLQGHGPQRKRVVRKVVSVVKLNNNMFETVAGLPEALNFVLDDPLINLQWLDLSFNQLTSVEPALLEFQNIKALYLHGNCIQSLSSVSSLQGLPKIMSLTLNGNPLGSSKTYRPYVIGAIQQLKSLDHTTVTEDEHTASKAWYEAHMKRLREREQRKLEMQMDAND